VGNRLAMAFPFCGRFGISFARHVASFNPHG
jgi:hypothetical protein